MTKASDNLFPGIIIRESADDGSDFSNPTADYRRLFLGEDGDLHLKDSSGTVTDIGGGGGGTTSLLAVLAYAPGSDTTIGTTSSATLVDVDATNLALAFTAPASGNVLVRLSAVGGPTSGGPAIRWGVRESSSIIAGPLLVDPIGITSARYYSAAFYITGVSGGAHTYKFAHACSSNTTAVYGGPTFGKAVMEIFGAP